MRFQLVDRVMSIQPGERIVATKALSLAEEYLADHFPTFPVLPGVLMLEGMTQSAAWLVRLAQDWQRSVVVLSTARNVRYASFAKPGDLLRYEVDAVSLADDVSKFKAATFVGDKQIVSARLELTSMNLAGRASHLGAADKQILAEVRGRWDLIGGPAALAAAGGAPAGA